MAAQISKAPVHKVPLTATYAHDVKAMVAADPNAGLIYICNPNNPTGTITPREEILWALENKPKGSILLVDEAYIHLSDEQHVLDQVAAGKDLIVLRTFSKIYGMAGIRCGVAIGRPDLLAKLQPYWQNAMPVTALAAARASLADTELIPTRKKWIADSRNETLAWLKANGYKPIGESQIQLLHDRHRPPGHGRDRRAAEGEGLHRPHLAGVAQRRAHLGGLAGRHGQVPHRLQEGHGRADDHRHGASRHLAEPGRHARRPLPLLEPRQPYGVAHGGEGVDGLDEQAKPRHPQQDEGHPPEVHVGQLAGRAARPEACRAARSAR